MAKIFTDCVIAASGTHKGNTQTQIERYVKRNGGVFTRVVVPDITHLITNEADILKGSTKVSQSIDANAHLVSIDWLLKSVNAGTKEPEADYALDVSTVGSQPSGTKRAAKHDDEDEDPAAKKVKITNSTARPKRGKAATPAPAVDPPAATRPRREKQATPAATAKAEGEAEDKKVAAGKGRPKKVAAPPATVKEEDEQDEPAKDEQPAKKKAPTMGKAKGKGKAKAKVEEESEEEDEEDQVVMKTVVKKGKAPVDELSGLGNSHHVYADASGTIWDATLNQTNIGANNNKFYYIQLLEHDAGGKYSVFCHWGRIGERGQSQFKCMDAPLHIALSAFDKQMKAKSGKYWSDRENARGGGKHYAYLERNYDDDDEDDTIKPLDEGPPVPMAESKLSKPLQNLMDLIFNQKFMQQSMASLSYDSKKLPLGKLSKTTIMQGYEVLKVIGDVIANPTEAVAKYSQYGSNNRDILNQLSSRYYTVIPHDFGRNTPPCIQSAQILKKETELVENLVDMKISSEIIKDANSNASSIHPVDAQYLSLGLNESEALDKNSTEFKNLEAYVKKTHGKTHRIKLAVEEIFRITRSVEEDRWVSAGWHQYPADNRKLLWHGSRTTNFGGILSQGLRIAPPEAPVNGYMFDKGIYLADVVSKSANYCCASASGNTGLLMLCEAQLGNPMLELTDSDYMAAEHCKNGGHIGTKGVGITAPVAWEDASAIHPQLKGVNMPKVTGNESSICADLKPPGAWLQYNEYIVYDVSQVKIRYLFRCKFS